MSDNPFKLLSTEIKYQNPWISVREDKVIRPGGKEGVFGIVTMLPGSTVLAINEKTQIILTKEFKYGANQYSSEVISGGLNKGELPMDAAVRELEEEVGYTAGTWIDAGVVNPFPTVVNSPNYMFIATDLTSTAINPDEGEIISYEWVDLELAYDMVIRSEIIHAASAMLILRAYILNKDGKLFTQS
ncbi:MAG: NUDIX hydrolase [bacterium]|nr:NUDIX hydrolase [bacterium]